MASFSTDQDQYKQIRKKLESALDHKRYIHTLGTANTAVSLAMAHNVDLAGAYTAGLLHDCAKCLKNDQKLKLCKKNNLLMNAAEKDNLDLLHAKLGSILARTKYDIEDEEILSAILYHTTGKPEMTTLEKIIYIADYIEPNRKPLNGMEEVRMAAFRDLDLAMKLILESTLSYLKEKGSTIDQTTIDTYDYFSRLARKGSLC